MQNNLINPHKKDMSYSLFGGVIKNACQYLTSTLTDEVYHNLLRIMEEHGDLSSIMLICKKYENKNLLSFIMRLSISQDIFINWGIVDRKLVDYFLYDVVNGKLGYSLEESLSSKNYPQFLRRVATSNDSDKFLVALFKQVLLASSLLKFSVKEKNSSGNDVMHYLINNQNGYDKIKLLLDFIAPEQYLDIYTFIKTVIIGMKISKSDSDNVNKTSELNLGLFVYYAEHEDWIILKKILSSYKNLIEQLYEFVKQKESRKYILPVFGLENK